MTDWKRVEEIFLAAAEQPAAARLAFLAAACSGDDELRREVESLLAHDAGTEASPFGRIVKDSAAGLDPRPALAPLPGRRAGPYLVTELLGHGGMGAVYLGVRADDQFRKKVAIKFVRAGMDTPAVVDRFLRERQILAGLDHPYIAKLLDGGATEDGTPYFVMEYVSGTPVDLYCVRENLSVEARCELFRRICEAVAYAHRSLVIHRDLKPGNILVTAEGTPALLDFGIARLVDGSSPNDRTHTGTWILTPDYASPEQIEGLPTTTSTDVYSLGVVFYQMLAGVKPYQTDSTALSPPERTIREQMPRRPSIAGANRRLAGDPDNIVLMALRKEPERRYSSVEQFSEDVRRYLRGLPVMAREDTLRYRASKFVRRNRVGVTAASLIAATLLGAVAATSREAKTADQARRVAEAARASAETERRKAAQASEVAMRRAKEAEEEKRKAQKRLSGLLDLANSSLYEVQGTLEHVAGALEARRDILTVTLKYLDGLAVDSGDDPEVISLLVSGYTQSGDVLGFPARPNLGDGDGALAAWAKARTLLARLNTLRTDPMDHLLQDVGLHQRVGVLMEFQGRPAAAIAEYQAALAGARALERAFPSKPLAVSQTGIVEHYLAATLAAQNRPDAALGHVRDEIAAYERVVRLAPGEAEYRLGLAAAYGNRGQLLVSARRFDEALAEYGRALALREKIFAGHPEDALTRGGIASTHLRMAVALGAPWQPSAGDRAGALEHAEKALVVYEALSAADPSNRKAKADLARALVYAGAIGSGSEASLPRLRRGGQLFADLLASEPKQTSYRNDLALASEYIGRVAGTETSAVSGPPRP